MYLSDLTCLQTYYYTQGCGVGVGSILVAVGGILVAVKVNKKGNDSDSDSETYLNTVKATYFI